jgi:hypothetical protein
MSTHETYSKTEEIAPGSDRAFGLVVGSVLVAIATYLYLGRSDMFLIPAVPGLLLMLLGLIRPAILHSLNVVWTRFSLLLGRVVTPIVMGLVFFTTVVPTGLLLRVSGKDLLSLKRKPEGASYWVCREPKGPTPESLRDQF